MVGGGVDLVVDRLGFLGDDKHGVLLKPLVKHVQRLRGGELIDDRIQRLVPAKQDARHAQHHRVGGKDGVKGVLFVLLRHVHGDKVRAAGGGIGAQADAAGKGTHNAAEHAAQQRVRRKRHVGQKVGQYAGEHDGHDRENRKLPPQKAQTNVDRNGVEQHVKYRKGDLQPQIGLKHRLQKQRKAGNSARIHLRRAHEGLDVDRNENRADRYQYQAAHVALGLKLQAFSSPSMSTNVGA